MYAKTPNRSRFSTAQQAANRSLSHSSKTSTNRFGSGVFSSAKKARHATSVRHQNQSLNRSVIDDGSGMAVESYGGSLPVLVTEALTLAEKSSQITVNIDCSDWAWLVCGRRLFVWRYRQKNSQGKVLMKATQCKELTLPASDLAHTAQLVCVISSVTDNQVTACICVSPEGVIRYWPSISHEGLFVEISADLKGEECAAMIYRPTYGCIVATTTSTLLQIIISRGQSPIVCRQLVTPQSTLARVSRRMSSFIFGSVTTQSTGAPFHQLLPAINDGTDDIAPNSFYMLSGCYLQKWLVSHETEKLVYQFEIEKKMKEAVSGELWRKDPAHLPELQFWLLDIQPVGGAICVLGATVNTEVSQDLYYVLASLPSNETMPEELISCSYVNHIELYDENDESRLLGYRLLIPDPNGTVAYLYNDSQCLRLSMSNLRAPVEKIEFLSTGGRIIGAGSSDSYALFFPLRHGFVVVKHSMNQSEHGFSMMDESALEPSIVETSTNVSRRVDESESDVTKLKTAILLNFRGKKAEMMSIVNALFPPSHPPEHNSPLDVTITQLSLDMIDDFPAADPRWAESAPIQDGNATTNSLILLHQLQDKLKAHQHFISFLHDACLWHRLSSTTVRNTPISTRRLLCEHAEKIVSTIALKNLHSDHQKMVDKVIKLTLKLRRSPKPENGLTFHDLFYRRISKIDQFFKVLMDDEMSGLAGDLSTEEGTALILKVNDILVSMLHDAVQYRQENASRYGDDLDVEFVPWTSAGGPDGLRTIIASQFKVTMDNVKCCAENRQTYLQQVMELADLQLDGYRQQLDCVDREGIPYAELLRKYEQERKLMIQPLVSEDEWERAANLAEKYLYFHVLASLCESLGDKERLKRYIQQFHDQGFTSYLLRFYMEEGKRGTVLNLPIDCQQTLDEFFESDENKFIRWLHQINNNDFTKAHLSLHELAQAEQDSLAKKKTLLSLSKLCALASDDSDELAHEVELIDIEHDVIAHQESLPECVFDRIALDPVNMSVFSIRDLVHLYTGPCNQQATEFDYKKAFDLLTLLEPGEDTEKLRLQVWCSAVNRDRWEAVEGQDPLDVNSDTIFFKTVELAHAEGLNLVEFLPDVTALLACEELSSLRSNATFQYLLRAGYEHVMTVTQNG